MKVHKYTNYTNIRVIIYLELLSIYKHFNAQLNSLYLEK